MRHTILLAGIALALSACAQERPRHFGPDRPGVGPHDRGDRPPLEDGWLFVSPMGEPFRMEHPEAAWFAGADADHDGRLTRAEFEADAMRIFARLDRQADGEIDPGDIESYETDLLPEIRVGGDMGGGGARGEGRVGRPGGACLVDCKTNTTLPINPHF